MCPTFYMCSTIVHAAMLPFLAIGLNDLFTVKKEVMAVAHRWKYLGHALMLDPSQLDNIAGEFEECLDRVLSMWLKQNYDTDQHGHACQSSE